MTYLASSGMLNLNSVNLRVTRNIVIVCHLRIVSCSSVIKIIYKYLVMRWFVRAS